MYEGVCVGWRVCTSEAADELYCVDLGVCRIMKEEVYKRVRECVMINKDAE